MYSAWAAAKHWRTAIRSVSSAPGSVFVMVEGWKETVEREEGVVPSTVLVIVESVSA